MKFYVVRQITIAGVIFALGACSDSTAEPATEGAEAPSVGAGAAGIADQSSNVSAMGTAGTDTAANTPVSTDQGKTSTVTTKKKDAGVTSTKGAAGASAKGTAGAAAPATAEPAKPTAEEQQILDMMADTSKRYDSTILTPVYEKLDTVPKEFMVGTWKGGLFIAGSNSTSTWYGKRVAPDFTAEPMLTKGADGGPGPNSGGGATVKDEEDANGVTTACLTYDSGAIKDYFRKVSGDVKKRALGDVVIGLGGGLFFNLTRVEL